MTAVTTTDSKVGLLKHRLERMTVSLVTILGNDDAANRQKLLTLLYFQQRPALQSCDVESIAEAVLQIAQWGLALGTEAHIVPRKGKAVAQKDYKGEIKLAIRDGRIRAYRHKTVGEFDEFEVLEGLSPNIVHKPNWKKPGASIGAYAIVTLPDGSTDFEVLNREQIEEVRKRSASASNGPWVTDWDEMAKKTVGRRLLKRHIGDVQDADDVGGDPAPKPVTALRAADPYAEAPVAALPPSTVEEAPDAES